MRNNKDGTSYEYSLIDEASGRYWDGHKLSNSPTIWTREISLRKARTAARARGMEVRAEVRECVRKLVQDPKIKNTVGEEMSVQIGRFFHRIAEAYAAKSGNRKPWHKMPGSNIAFSAQFIGVACMDVLDKIPAAKIASHPIPVIADINEDLGKLTVAERRDRGDFIHAGAISDQGYVHHLLLFRDEAHIAQYALQSNEPFAVIELD